MFEPGLARWMMKKSKEKLKNVSNTLLLESTRNTGWLGDELPPFGEEDMDEELICFVCWAENPANPFTAAPDPQLLLL